MGTLSFDEAYDAFKEVVIASSDKVDGYIIETFSDLYELKAAVLAVKENSDKPLFVTMTFDKTGRTLTGTTPEIMVAFLENLGVDALGVNCSLGPNELYDVVKRILDASHTPVIIQPNRGLPKLVNGVSTYDLSVEEFTNSVEKYVGMGVSVIGGCCGTDPSFIASISKFKGLPVNKAENSKKTVITSCSKYVEITDDTVFADLTVDDSLMEDGCEDIAYDVLDMVDDGADVINITSNGATSGVIRALVKKIQEFSNVPIRLVSEDKDIINCFNRYYNGTPLV